MIRSRDGVLQLGPGDAGIELEGEEFERAICEDGFRYELVAGRLVVMTPDPNPPHWIAVKEVFSALLKYSQEHPAILGSVGPGGRLITRALGATTNVQPDICAYRQTVTRKHRTWHHIMPCLVVEVLSETDRDKDLVRNRDIYGLVAEIEEYWVVDAYAEPEATLLAFLRDADGRWGLERRVPPGGTYRTDLLPGFELDLAAIFREP